MSMVGHALASGRRIAERLMTDQCVVRRPTGKMVTDPDTLEAVRELVVVYDPREAPHFGKWKMASYEAFEQEREMAGATQVINRIFAHFPAGAFHPMTGDVATALVAGDPMLEGRHLRLMVEAPYKTNATAYRCAAEVNVGEVVPAWIP